MSPRQKLFVEENWVLVSLIASLTDQEMSSTHVWFKVQLIKNRKINFFQVGRDFFSQLYMWVFQFL